MFSHKEQRVNRVNAPYELFKNWFHLSASYCRTVFRLHNIYISLAYLARASLTATHNALRKEKSDSKKNLKPSASPT